jgi:hypothetical protein
MPVMYVTPGSPTVSNVAEGRMWSASQSQAEQHRKQRNKDENK